MGDTSTIITAIATLVTALTALASVLLNSRRIKTLDTKVEEVHSEVKTANSLSIAQLADADETRRIDHIPKKSRTRGEKEHIKIVAIPPQKSKIP